MLHIIYLSVFFPSLGEILSLVSFRMLCQDFLFTRNSLPCQCLWDSDSHLCSLTMGDHVVRHRQAGIRGIVSVLLLFLPYFFLCFGEGWASTVLWGSSACAVLQPCHSSVPVLPALPGPWELPGHPGKANAGMQGQRLTCSCLPACRLVTTLEVSPSVYQPYFAWIGLALWWHKEFLLVTQL